MRSAHILAGAVVIACLAIGTAFADQHGHPASTPHGNPHATPTPTTATAPTHGSARTTTPTTTATTTTTATMNPIAAKISSHPQQAARIERMLPAGMTLNQASLGFRNQGQFIAALHVSQNLHIPFVDLKRAMTGPNAMSLGQAIHTLRPAANAGAAVRRANTQTHSDVQ